MKFHTLVETKVRRNEEQKKRRVEHTEETQMGFQKMTHRKIETDREGIGGKKRYRGKHKRTLLSCCCCC
jgi:hypothetical protein